MALSVTARRIAGIAVPAVVIVAATLAILHLRTRREAVAETARPANVAATTSAPERVPTEPQPGPTGVGFNPDDPATFGALADAAVSELHPGISLEHWKNSQDKSEDWQPSKDENFFDCRTFVKIETLPSGRQIKHYVYFYPPEAPTPAVFPIASADDLIDHDCRLSMVRVQTAANTDRDGQAFERALQQPFLKKYGESIGMKGTYYEHAPEGAHWMAASEILSAYDSHPRPNDDDDPNAATRGIVFVFARLPIVHEVYEDACCRLHDHYHTIEIEQFHQALTITAADAALTNRMATLFQHLFRRIDTSPPPSDLDESRAAVLPTLRDWLNAANSLPPLRHAAGLYVADRLLVAAGDNGWLELIAKDQTGLRAALEKLGASFDYNELGGCYDYHGTWLDQARELDPEGVVGQMSVLIALARGGFPKLPKDKNEELDVFHTVISDGEWLLSKKPDAARAAEIHFIIGDANATIVALAGGAEPDYGDPSGYQPETPAARHNALEHYRAGLAIDGTSDNAKMAWLQAWKISAGLLPDTRWAYIND